jgi:hypothetical protein
MKLSRLAPCISAAAVALASTLLANTPPDLLNYQGVLRNASNQPLDGSFDMVFRFLEAASGDEALVDRHDGANQVIVDGGLFNVQLGGGVVSDGAGPGTYTALSQVFRDFGNVLLRVEIDGETLSPDVRVLSAGYALNATYLNGVFESQFLRSDENDTAVGKIFFAGDPSGPGISQGSVFISPGAAAANETLLGVAVASADRFKVDAEGDTTVQGRLGLGAAAPDTKLEIVDGSITLDGSGLGTWGGIWLKTQHLGTSANHHMILRGEEDASLAESLSVYHRNATPTDDPGTTERAFRIQWDGTTMLGSSASALANPPAGGALVADGPIWNLGTSLYMNQDGPLADVSLYFYDDGSPEGDSIRFSTTDDSFSFSGTLRVDGSILLDGNILQDGTTTSMNVVGPDANQFIRFFEDGSSLGEQLQWDNTNDRFLFSDSLFVGGDLDASGAKNFVQNHPFRPDLSIVYSALEGGEVATYTRGSARLEAGVARIALDETFALVTLPGPGLTAHLTPRGEPALLYVESLTTETLVVRASAESPQDAAFDYAVLGLRIGFENRSVLKPRAAEAPIPFAAHEERVYAERPDLRGYSPLARFARMTDTAVDTDAAATLRGGIGEHDPDGPTAETLAVGVDQVPRSDGANVVTDVPEPGPPAAARDGERVPSIMPLEWIDLKLSGSAEPGDLLALDPQRPGLMRVATIPGDPGVVGVSMGEATVVEDGTWRVPVASSGIVTVRADAGYGAIQAGDLVQSSATAGHAMRATEPLPGTVVGKALDRLDTGIGTIRIVVVLR